jgi:Secretion system C-terminal sorting domain
MKKIMTIFLAHVIALCSLANEAQLLVQRVDNSNAVQGSTYRLYAQMPSAQHSLHVVFGNAQHPLSIQSTDPFYQHPLGGNSAMGINDAVVAASPTLVYDSYITLGYTSSTDNSMWELGLDFSSFNSGSSISTSNGGWFLLPTDDKCTAPANQLILLAQFTTTGIVTGTLNLQGWTGPQQAWQASALTFSTENAVTFGCTTNNATNYNPQATFNDGSCIFGSVDVNTNQAANTTESKASAGDLNWEVFPNPLSNDLIHIQFKNAIDLKDATATLDIMDSAGRKVYSQNIAGSLADNKVTITQQLANGNYSVVLTHAGKREVRTLVVQK